MIIKYFINGNVQTYTQDDLTYIENLNFLLTNNKGDFLNLGFEKNTTKFQGFNFCDVKTKEIYKLIDEIILENSILEEVEYNGYTIKRKFIDGTRDKFFLGNNSSFVYEIEAKNKTLTIDLDCRKKVDFDPWNRTFEVKKKNKTIIAKYEKKSNTNHKYNLYIGIKVLKNSTENMIQNWVEKEYTYSKARNSMHKLYVYRFLNLTIKKKEKIIFGFGLSEKEAINNIEELEKHQISIENKKSAEVNEITTNSKFRKPLSNNINLAYNLSKNAIYNFLNTRLETEPKKGSYAGFPWFSEIWTRDELASLNSHIELSNYAFVKQKLIYYLNNINKETGMLKRIEMDNSLESSDSLFWLSKRFDDFIFKLDSEKKLYEIFTSEEIEDIYKKLSIAFNKLIKSHWNRTEELLDVKFGDSWMDTIEVNHPIDIQVQLLAFISILGTLSRILEIKKDTKLLLDLEIELREVIRKKYVRNNMTLYDEPYEDKISSNIFLVYYFYKNLFIKADWEKLFDNSLKVLKTNWGGISSLSKKDPHFKNRYTGENNLSYHRGDSWFWINNLAAIALNEVNPKKYETEIKNIIMTSTKDILEIGCIGFSSELSSSETQLPEGCFAQLWSSSFYLEMIDKIFEKEK